MQFYISNLATLSVVEVSSLSRQESGKLKQLNTGAQILAILLLLL